MIANDIYILVTARLANLRVKKIVRFKMFALFDFYNMYEIGENLAKISRISHSNDPILVGRYSKSPAECARVG